MKEFKKIGILTSGGDAPGMNAAVRAVVRTAISNGVEVMGIYRGYSGLIDGDVRPLGIRDVSNIINSGGTTLYTDRCPEMLTKEGKEKALKTCRELGIEALVAIGGDGTFRGATALNSLGLPCVGIPATIDNDITSTDNTIGYDTCMNTVVNLVDKLRDTCESHARCSVIEVMGRYAGDIALNTAIASGATSVVLPEFDYDKEALFEKIKRSKKLGKRNFIVIVSEGLGSTYGEQLTTEIEKNTGVEARFVRFAHIVRGGRPNLRDRVMASTMGVHAVRELLDGKSDLVICEKNSKIVSIDINYALDLDMLYKLKIDDSVLEKKYDAATIAKMHADVEKRRNDMKYLYDIANTVNL